MFSEADSAGKFYIRVGKDLRRESLDGRALAPRIQRQTSFAAGLLKKSFPTPTVFDWNLRQQQSASSAIRDEQPVAPDFHYLGMNRGQAGEHAQRNLQPKSFFLRHRQETGIFESSGACRLGHSAIQRRDGQGIADASSEFATKVVVKIAFEIKSGEDAAGLRQPGRRRSLRKRRKSLPLCSAVSSVVRILAPQSVKNRLARYVEQSAALIQREFRR